MISINVRSFFLAVLLWNQSCTPHQFGFKFSTVKLPLLSVMFPVELNIANGLPRYNSVKSKNYNLAQQFIMSKLGTGYMFR
jgi:hypothetical protein